MIIKPTDDNVLIEIEKPEEMTKSGILIPENSRESTCRGKVLAIGQDVSYPIKIGNTVIMSKYSDMMKNVIVLDDVNYVLIKQKEILATIE